METQQIEVGDKSIAEIVEFLKALKQEEKMGLIEIKVIVEIKPLTPLLEMAQA